MVRVSPDDQAGQAALPPVIVEPDALPDSVLRDLPRSFVVSPGAEDDVAKAKREAKALSALETGTAKSESVSRRQIGGGSGPAGEKAASAAAAAAAEEGEEEEFGPLTVYRDGPREVSLFWFDLAWTVVDFLQLQGLLWVAGRQWNLPHDWTFASRFLVLFNLDYWSFVAWNWQYQMQVERPIALWVTGWLAAMGLACAALAWRYSRKLVSKPVHRKSLLYLMARVGELLVAPATLVFIRAVHCLPEGHVLTAEQARLPELRPNQYCGSISHAGAATAAALSCAAPLGLLAHFWHASIDKVLPGRGNEAFETFLRQKEIEWLLQLSPEWFWDHFRLCSSYRRHAVYFRPLVAARKVLVAIILFAMHGFAEEQAALLGWLSAAYGVAMVWRPPYRCAANNIALLVFECATCLNLYLIAMASLRVRNTLSGSSALTRTLGTLSLGAIVLVIMALPLLLGRAAKLRHLVEATTGPLTPWPINDYVLRCVLGDAKSVEWLKLLHEARAHRRAHRFTPSRFYPVHQTLELAERLKEAHAAAKGSVLRNSLFETLESCYAAAHTVGDRSFYPNPLLEGCIPAFAGRLRRRDREMVLMAPRKRRILNKLLAMSLWSDACGDFVGMPTAVVESDAATALSRARDLCAATDLDLDQLSRCRTRLRSVLDAGEVLSEAIHRDLRRAIHEVDAKLISDLQ